MSKFNLILLCVFGVFILGGVLVFALSRGSSSTTASATLWGTIPASEFNQFMNDSGLNQDKSVSITYVEKNPNTLDADFTEALAEGRGPDLIILPQSLVWKERNKIAVIPYTSVTQADYTQTFIDEGSLFLTPSGLYALPLYIDPMVLYSNKGILASNGYAKPLSYWDEIYAETSALTTKDAAGNITRSTIALGTTGNIPHVKDILSLLLLEAGTPITRLSSSGLISELSSSENLPTPPANSAVDFYTQFSNPEKAFYSWNRSLLPADTNFVSGQSAYYLGYASEYPTLRAKNPTLGLGVSIVPQARSSSKTLTFARLYGVAVSKSSHNPSGALAVALKLISSVNASAFAKETGLPPARRDLLSVKQNDPAEAVFFTAAIQSAGWLDPNETKSATIFTTLLDDVTSGRAGTVEAVSSADDRLSALISTTP